MGHSVLTTFAAIVHFPDWPQPIRLVQRAATPEDARSQARERLRPDFGEAIDNVEIEILPLRDAIR